MKKIKVTFPLSDLPKETVLELEFINFVLKGFSKKERNTFIESLNNVFGASLLDLFCKNVKKIYKKLNGEID